MSDPEPPSRVCVKKIVQIIKTVGQITTIQYYDLNGELLFSTSENINEQSSATTDSSKV